MSGEALVRNAADEQQLAQAAATQKRQARQYLSDLRTVLDTPAGRRLIWRWLSMTGIYRLSYAGEQQSATNFHEGQRDIGLRMLAGLEQVDPTAVYRMAQEAARELAAARRQPQPAKTPAPEPPEGTTGSGAS